MAADDTSGWMDDEPRGGLQPVEREVRTIGAGLIVGLVRQWANEPNRTAQDAAALLMEVMEALTGGSQTR